MPCHSKVLERIGIGEFLEWLRKEKQLPLLEWLRKEKIKLTKEKEGEAQKKLH